jgi:hypothetical protein
MRFERYHLEQIVVSNRYHSWRGMFRRQEDHFSQNSRPWETVTATGRTKESSLTAMSRSVDGLPSFPRNERHESQGSDGVGLRGMKDDVCQCAAQRDQ